MLSIKFALLNLPVSRSQNKIEDDILFGRYCCAAATGFVLALPVLSVSKTNHNFVNKKIGYDSFCFLKEPFYRIY